MLDVLKIHLAKYIICLIDSNSLIRQELAGVRIHCNRIHEPSSHLWPAGLAFLLTLVCLQLLLAFARLEGMIHTPTDLRITKSKRGALDPGHYRSNVRCLTLWWEHGTPNHTCRNTCVYIYIYIYIITLYNMIYIIFHYITLHYITLH